ncbi:MAG: sigma-70 family RNA polymerase sigma factor [Cephaloticoccus sp.]|nr:sigma-70 family RNA polymerase sigma factor [Cephaloticoccus sp.]
MEPLPAFSVPENTVDNYDDVELLVRISDRERDPVDAEAAFTIFFNRHAGFLAAACKKYRYYHTTLGADDVVLRVMSEIFNGNAEFSAPDNPNPEFVRKHLRAWLIQVAKYQFCSEIRKLRFDKDVAKMDEKSAEGVTPAIYGEDDTQSPMSADRASILRFREALPLVDQIILDRSLPYYDRGTQTFNLPPKVAQALAAEVGKSIVAVRKRRQRIMTAMCTALAS